MLKQLSIKNYVLIDSLEVDFSKGLIIITGETGAGKSILLGALQLMLGGKAESGIVKGDGNCVVEGVFQLESPVEVSWQEGNVTRESELILRRVITPGGRSRAFINDEPVPLATIAALAGKLVDIHTQHQHLLLCNETFQTSILDHFAGSSRLLGEYSSLHNLYKSALKELAEAERKSAESRTQEEYKTFVLEKLTAAEISEGELAAIEQEQRELANAEEVKSSLYRASELFQNDEFSLVRNLKEASALLYRFADCVPGVGTLAERIESCRIECKDIADELDSSAERVEINPQRLERVEARIGELYDLMHKYNCSTEAELISYREALKRELSQSESSGERMIKLKERVGELLEERGEKARQLSAMRAGAVGKLSEELQGMIRGLGMPKALFRAELEELDELGEIGAEKVRFLFSANGDPDAGELSRVASGGELSRIMLCLKSLLARYTGMPTLIFDEIDTGVSGGTADKMGKMIDELGRMMQVIAITHLPQIASKGNTHLLVYKENRANGARTGIRKLSPEERIMEIARLLSGEELSAAAIENAKALLGGD